MNPRHVLAAVAIASLSATSAQAALLVIDDFDVPTPLPVSIQDNTIGGPAPSMASATTAGNLASSRMVSIDMTARAFLGEAEAIMGGPASQGFLVASNDAGVNSVLTVDWTIGAFAPPVGAVNFLFNVLFSNLGTLPGGGTAPTQLAFSFDADAGPAGDFAFSQFLGQVGVGGSQAVFALTAPQAASLAGGGKLTMVGSSAAPAWEFVLDTFELVPEPASLALVGLGLLGAGMSSRRRKSV
jgi:hypothetical protein